jgi:hypothetical protein
MSLVSEWTLSVATGGAPTTMPPEMAPVHVSVGVPPSQAAKAGGATLSDARLSHASPAAMAAINPMRGQRPLRILPETNSPGRVAL